MSKHGLIESLRADVHARTEAPTGGVRLIIGYKAISTLLLLTVALLLLGIIVDRDWGERVRMVLVLTGLRSDNHFLRDALLKVGLLGRRSTTALGIVSFLYAMLEATEVIGLLNRRRWAEYLVLIATVLFLPYEGLELFRHITVSNFVIFAINIAIAVYLVKRKRLFQHPEDQVAQDRAASRPPDIIAERLP
ncbi:MAG: DUF2127 domain-containing protein [Chloroflexota bacterium]